MSDTRYTIYQPKDTPEGNELLFMNYERCQRMNLDINIRNYDEVYTGVMPEGKDLEYLFYKFNMDHPSDFKGHSLSVSDIVVLETEGHKAAHFVDSIGYKEIPDFFKGEREKPSLDDMVTDAKNRIPTETTPEVKPYER